MIQIEKKKIYILSLLILILPNIIFFLGWLSPIYATISCLGIGACFFQACKVINDDILEESLNIEWSAFLLIIVSAFFIIFLSGIGGFFPQTYDHIARNPIFRDIVEQQWPVVYNETNNALVYYFGYWLPSALIGKIGILVFGNYIGWKVANITLYLYSVFSIMLVILLILTYITNSRKKILNKKIIALALLIFSFYGGVDLIGFMFRQILQVGRFTDFANTHIDHYFPDFARINGIFIQLMYVFNQSIPAMIATCLFVNLKKCYSIYALIGLTLFNTSPFPLVGLAILMISYVIKLLVWNKKINLKKLFSFTNCISCIIILPICLLFYHGVNSANLWIKDIFASYGWVKGIIIVIIIFLCEFGLYTICIIHKYKKDFLLYICNVSMIVFFFIAIGSNADFTMRATIPGCVYIMLLVIEYFYNEFDTAQKKIGFYGIIILLSIASISPMIDLTNMTTIALEKGTLKVPYDIYYTLSNTNDSSKIWFLPQYIKENPHHDFFFKNLSKIDEIADINLPIIQTNQNENQVYIEKISINKNSIDKLFDVAYSEDLNYLKNKLQEISLDNKVHIIEFDKNKVFPKNREPLDTKKFNLDIIWDNYTKKYNNDKNLIMAEIKIKNTGKDIILSGNPESPILRCGIAVSLFDKKTDEIIYPYSYQYITSTIFPEQVKTLIIPIPKPLEKGTYNLVFDFFQDEDENGNNAFHLSDLYGQENIYEIIIK